MKKSYTASFKAQVVLELLKETKTLAQLASEHRFTVTVLREWKLAALKGLPDLFERRDSVSELKATHERELAELYAEIGRLTTHVNFLKKRTLSQATFHQVRNAVACSVGRALLQLTAVFQKQDLATYWCAVN